MRLKVNNRLGTSGLVMRCTCSIFGILLILMPAQQLQAIPVEMDSDSLAMEDLLSSNELSLFPRDLFGSVIAAIRAGNREKAKLRLRRILTAYPEHPIAWEFDGTLKLLENDIKGAEKSLIQALVFMPERSMARAKMGLVRLAQNKTNDAKKLFKQALLADPENWIAHRYLAQIANTEGDSELALVHYQKIVSSAVTSFTDIHAQYARTLANLKRYPQMLQLLKPLSSSANNIELPLLLAEAMINLGQLESADQQLKKVAAIAPDDRRGQLLSAVVKRVSGNNQQAIKALGVYLQSQPDSALAHFQLGLAFSADQQQEKAVQAFNRALDSLSEDSALRMKLAMQFEKAGMPKQVIATLEPLARTQIRKDVFYLLVQAYAKTGNWRRALKHAEKLIIQYPDFVAAKLLKVELLKGLSKPKAAESYLSEIITQFPDSALAWENYMTSLASSGTTEQGLSRLAAVVDQYSDNQKLKMLLANSYQQAGYAEQAETVYRELLQSKSNHPGVLNNLAMVLAQQNKQLSEALSFSKKAQELVPNNAAITDTLGWMHYKLKNYSQARQQFELALTQQAKMPEARCHLGLVMHQQGEKKAARDLLESCLLPTIDKQLQEAAKQLL